jgi:hypothetical protein
VLGASQGLGPAIAAIDLVALRANFREATRLAGRRRVIAVVKADAYGHGAAPVARALVAAGCDTLATWSVGEAVALRDAGIEARLLVLGGVRDAAEADEAIAHALIAVLHDAPGRTLLAAAARRRAGAPARTSRSTPACGGWRCRSWRSRSRPAAVPRRSRVRRGRPRADPRAAARVRELRRRAGAAWRLRARREPRAARRPERALGRWSPADAVRPGLLHGAQPSPGDAPTCGR